jgi:hypothetical protein
MAVCFVETISKLELGPPSPCPLPKERVSLYGIRGYDVSPRLNPTAGYSVDFSLRISGFYKCRCLPHAGSKLP